MDIKTYFKAALDKGASDLHLISGNRPMLRIQGQLEPLSDQSLDPKQLADAVFKAIDPEDVETYKKKKAVDFALEISGGYFRVNLHQQEGTVGLTARVVPEKIPSPKDIDLNETVYSLSHLNDGLVLVTGPTGSGKSTTLATLIELINHERKAHVVTIEDPIEFRFKEQQSIIEQRELGRDTHDFAEALRSVLRQDPNVIMVGEMRDIDTISATLTAAETGHLVLSTLHTSTAAETIERVVDMFPDHRQQQILIQLASTLRAVVCQQLLPKKGGGRVVAREILVNTPAISNLIREDKIAHIPSAIQTSGKLGMVTMNKAITALYEQGLIEETTYRNRLREGDKVGTYY
ncbi:type IV pili twitching motility protein PilT [archaeon]|nr:type IV pili twitching motility protein PilT [archaeon]